MWKQAIAGVLLAACMSPALGSSCPTIMHDIDEMLNDNAVVSGLDESELERVRELRAEGEKLHKSGDHGESVDVLNEAMAILEDSDGGSSSSGSGYSY